MKNMIMKSIHCLFLLMLPLVCFCITPEELKAKIDAKEPVTIIDIRSNEAYQAAHIVGAINIPGRIIPGKKLPPLGEVVVCGDGIICDTVAQALDELNNKPGINATVLDGGFSLWTALCLPATRSSGLEEESMTYVTYNELLRVISFNPSAVLVDVRTTAPNNTADKGKSLSMPLTALADTFPGMMIFSDGIANIKRFNPRVLYILVDLGDGVAEECVRLLKSAGIKRTAILAGGEIAITAKGESSSFKARQ